MSLKVAQAKVTEAIDAVKWTTQGDDQEAAAETRRRSRLTGPDCVAFLNYVMRTDGFASTVQRVRAASTLLEVGQFLSFEAKRTGLFDDASDGDGERAAS
jgi:hypothetical protein